MATINERASRIKGEIIRRYFLDRSGVPTQRMANLPGKGHFEIAQQIVGMETPDVYARMAALSFARVLETTEELHVEAKQLTALQKRYLHNRALDMKVELVVNSQSFIESKDPRAKIVVDCLLS